MRNYADARARGRPGAVHVAAWWRACRWSAIATSRHARQRPRSWYGAFGDDRALSPEADRDF